MRWAEIVIHASHDAEEAVTAALLGAGCSGVAADVTAFDPGDELDISGWLPATNGVRARLEALRSTLNDLPAHGLPLVADMVVRYVEDVDWLEEWRKHHHAHPIGRRLVIAPPWEAAVCETGRSVVLIDPGMAFGTGSHPTTRLCLELLDRMVRPGDEVADVGAGSGILGIAALRLGARAVWASEIDSLPRAVAARNARANGVGERLTILDPESFETVCPCCRIVACNIVPDTIVELAPMLARLALSGGVVIVSGVVAERLQPVTEALRRNRLVPTEVLSEDVWRAVVAIRQ
jgi:ribosomal protein L11 methyltransferase